MGDSGIFSLLCENYVEMSVNKIKSPSPKQNRVDSTEHLITAPMF